MSKYLLKGEPVSEARFRVALGAREDETTQDAIARVAAEYQRRTGRSGPTRNTVDEDMTFAELIGLPDLDEDPAIEMVMADIPTGSAAEKYRARQLQKHEADKREREAKERLDAAKGGDRAAITAKAVSWSERLRHRYTARYGKKPKWKCTDAKAARKFKRSDNAVRNARQEKQRENRLE